MEDQTIQHESQVAYDSKGASAAKKNLRPGKQRSAAREDLPHLLLVWCIWVLFSWFSLRMISGWNLREVAGGIFSAPGESVTRWMVLMIFMGLMLIWPLYRLSQRPLQTSQGQAISNRGWRLLLDWFSMFLLFQIILWPLQHMSFWSIDQAIYIDITVGAWSLITGFIIDWGLRFDKPSMRTAAMILCVALIFLEPAVQAIIHILGLSLIWPMNISPLGVFVHLTVPFYDLNIQTILPHIYSAVGIAVGGWIITLSLRTSK